ncbi:MAG: ABC transporter ATP-binding protein [Desulfatibacillaceae bacterium]|nr:ABC transporter ATP-binding protein [Desulfatibacillaceae bacterium]
MFGEYGYEEEGPLPKTYDLALLRRLSGFVRPYLLLVILALVAGIAITAVSLVVPFVTKLALDRHIVAEWYRLDTKSPTAQRAVEDLQGRFEREAAGQGLFVSATELVRLDPRLVKDLRDLGALSSAAFYRLEPNKTALARQHGLKIIVDEAASAFVGHNELAALDPQARKALREADIRGTAAMGLLLFALAVAAFAFGYWEYIWLERAGQGIMADIRVELFTRVQSQGLAFFDRNPVGRLSTRVTNDVENLNELFKSVMVTLFKDILLLLGIIVLLAVLNWRLALLCFALIPVVFVLAMLFSRLARSVFRKLRETVSAINSFCQERFAAVRTVKLLNARAAQEEEFAEINQQNYDAGMSQIKVFGIFMPLMEWLASLGVALLLWRGGILVIEDRVTLGTLVAFISYLRMFFRPLRDISEKFNIMQAALASTERIVEYLDTDQRLQEPAAPKKPAPGPPAVAFENVDFAYDPAKPVLEDVSFEIPAGEMVALVGRTGEGKTTCAHLLNRFYDPARGAVRVGGVSMRDADPAWRTSRIALVSQDVFLFSATLTENVALGRKALRPDALEHALKLCGAWGFVAGLEKGPETVLSERGANLSGGERQLLSFARALYSDPDILILDEATSSVDPQTERAIQDAVSAMTSKRTTLVVAHRISTIEKARTIIVLNKGRIAEIGSHSELMEKQGLYYKLRRVWKAASVEQATGQNPA